PNAILLHRDLVDLDVVDLELVRLLVHPEIDVVILILATGFPEVGADEILALFFEVPHRLVDLDEVERPSLSRLVVLNVEMAIGVLMRGDIGVDRAHHLPSARHLSAARMLLNGEPPPSDRHAGDHHIAVTFLLRTFLHPDIHQGELVTLGLEPEIDGVLLLGLILVVEDGIGEPGGTSWIDFLAHFGRFLEGRSQRLACNRNHADCGAAGLTQVSHYITLGCSRALRLNGREATGSGSRLSRARRKTRPKFERVASPSLARMLALVIGLRLR